MLSLQTSRDKYNVANYRLLQGCLIWHLNINTTLSQPHLSN